MYKKKNLNKGGLYIKRSFINITMPDRMGFIIRTFGLNQKLITLRWELNTLISQYNAIKLFYHNTRKPCLIYEEESLITRIIKNYLKLEIDEIIIDDINIFNMIYKYFKIIKPKVIFKIKLYKSKLNLFHKYNVEHQTELCFKREVFLPSGGSLIIDYTEAIVSVDVNSSRSNSCDEMEHTALQTNLESIIEKTLEEILSYDRSKIRLERISRFSLMEISRQSSKNNITNVNKLNCQFCNGMGKIYSIEKISNLLVEIAGLFI